MVDLLLDAGADVNAAEDHGVTPLARASKNASAGMVERLLAAGADPNAAQTNGLTPLMIAAQTGNVDVVRALLARGADPNAAAAETGATALMWAMEEAHADVVRVLLEQGATVSASTTKGFTPLITAARQGNIEMAAILIEAGARVNATGSDGTHALPLAILYGQYDFAHYLLEKGADPNASMAGIHALHAAAGKVTHWLTHWNREHGGSGLGSSIYNPGLGMDGRLGMVKALLAHGADPNARIATSAMFMSYIGHPKKGAFERYACGTGDLRGATALWVAAFGANSSFGQVFGEFAVLNRSNSSAEIITTLLEAGADMSLTTVDGTTPLMAAAGLGAATYTPREPRGLRSEGGEAAVRVLLEAGADINQVNEADFSALHGAAFRGLNEIVELLVENGADIDARDFRGPHAVPPGGRLEAVVPVPVVAGDGRAAGRPRRRHPPGRSGHRAGTGRPRGGRVAARQVPRTAAPRHRQASQQQQRAADLQRAQHLGEQHPAHRRRHHRLQQQAHRGEAGGQVRHCIRDQTLSGDVRDQRQRGDREPGLGRAGGRSARRRRTRCRAGRSQRHCSTTP